MWHDSIELPTTGRAQSIEIRLPGWGVLEGRASAHAGLLVKRELPPCLEEDSDARCLLDAYTGAMTDAAGRFEFERIAPGSHRITLFPGDGEIDGGRVSIREGAKANVEVP
jgi:hypothetical protein